MAATMKTLVDDAPARPWAPKYPDIDPIEERIVMKKMRRHISKLDSVQFYRNFRDQLRTPPISEYLQEVLGSESKMEMVIYGIGKIELHEDPRRQLSLAILLKRDFEWIGDIQVFEPLLSATECKILENLGCSVLSLNEDGKRKALKPTMFFMPYCSSDLFDNLLQANWTLGLLSNIVLFGNRLKALDDPDMNHISTATKFTLEFLIRGGPNAFIDFSWQFFRPIAETELQFMNDFALNGGRVERENSDYALNMDITETAERRKTITKLKI
ncbi:hypothetical protein K1719_009928 [Acacia pycnantha]|nr:hypothetical protein K1719_009928 [Acacia pycnantha]